MKRGAGPGSGKTLLAMKLFLCEKARPEELVLSTSSEKAARELQDRMLALADQVCIGPIHSICQRIIHAYLHHTQERQW